MLIRKLSVNARPVLLLLLMLLLPVLVGGCGEPRVDIDDLCPFLDQIDSGRVFINGSDVPLLEDYPPAGLTQLLREHPFAKWKHQSGGDWQLPPGMEADFTLYAGEQWLHVTLVQPGTISVSVQADGMEPSRHLFTSLSEGKYSALLDYVQAASQAPLAWYQQAWQELTAASSFQTEAEVSLGSSPGQPATASQAQVLIQIARDGGAYRGVLQSQGVVDGQPQPVDTVYYQDGWAYYPAEEPQDNRRLEVSDDLVWSFATEGLLDESLLGLELEPPLVARQNAEASGNGLLLTFYLDPEAFYAHRFPRTSAEYADGEFGSYREPPLYTVLLDNDGRLSQVSGVFILDNANGYSEDYRYTISYGNFDQTSPDLPPLDPADYREIRQ